MTYTVNYGAIDQCNAQWNALSAKISQNTDELHSLINMARSLWEGGGAEHALPIIGQVEQAARQYVDANRVMTGKINEAKVCFQEADARGKLKFLA